MSLKNSHRSLNLLGAFKGQANKIKHNIYTGPLCKLYGELKKFIIVNNDDRLILMSDEFICPECGSKEAGEHIMVSREPPAGKNKKDPWASILQQTECASCKMIIPDHLGDRWDNMSIKEAQKEWKEIYRKTSRYQKL